MTGPYRPTDRKTKYVVSLTTKVLALTMFVLDYKLKLAAPIICHPLAYICNLSLFTSHFLQNGKLQIIYTRVVIRVM